MGILRAPIFLTLLASVSGNYFIAAPNTMRPETDFGVEVSYTGQGALNVEATLSISGQNPLVSKTEALNNGRKLITLVIPSVVPDGSYNLTVVGRNSANQEVFRNSSVIQLESDNSLIFVQTDKSIYKPRQTVNFRVLCVDQALKPRTAPTDIAIFDENDNKLEEWLATEGEGGVIMKSYTLSDLPPLGEWRIKVTNMVPYGETEKKFTVDKYVLPKFEVQAESDTPDLVQGESGGFNIKVTAKYTFGKPVLGRATFIFGENRNTKAVSVTLAPNAKGVHTQSFTMEDVQGQMTYNGLKVVVNVTEAATAVTQVSNQISINVHNQRVTFEFLPSSSQVYHPGLPVSLKVRAYDVVAKEAAYVGALVNFTGSTMTATTTIDAQGLATQSFDIPIEPAISYLNFNAKLIVDGVVKRTAYHSPQSYQTKLKTMLTTEVTSAMPAMFDGSFDIEIRASGTISNVAYLVLGRGKVVQSGMVSMSGLSRTVTVPANKEMAPSAQVLVYGIVSDGKTSEVIADSTEVQVKGLFDNEVSLTFGALEARTGSEVDVTVATEGDSRYYILAVDKSVLLLGTGNDITQSQVIGGMQKFALGETPNYKGDPEPHGGIMGDMIMPRPGGGSSQEDVPTSAGQLFKMVGLVYMSGNIVAEPEEVPDMVFLMDGPPMLNRNFAEAGVAMPDASGAKTEFAAVGKVRKSFPEAWLWMDGAMNGQASVTFKQTVPDTITEWVATAFSVSGSKGLAITEQSSKLTAFKPFFASMTLPYAIKRGEIFPLRVTIFNYMTTPQSTPVRVTLKRSDDFGIMEKDANGKMTVISKDVVEEIQVERNIPQSLTFNISANKLGKIQIHVLAQPDQSTRETGDNLLRDLWVKPEGIIQHEVIGETIELDESTTSTFDRTIPITFPDEVVNGSKRIEVKVTGDIMGPTVEGLESLIRMPTGCGEQNMITLVPNIVVHKYLKEVNRLPQELGDKAVQNMKIGYQRELTYKHKDGSFSAFGESDGDGSTWLTAFVMKCFSQARDDITVSAEIMKAAFTWVKDKQNADGTFRNVGRVIHTEMQGGSTGSFAMTAFMYIALKESQSFLSLTDQQVLEKTRNYLENLVSGNQLSKPYDMAIVAYALSLDNSASAKTLLDLLENEKKPWESTTTDEVPVPVEDPAGRRMIMPTPHPPKGTPGDIELWSYALLAYTKRNEIVNGQPIMKWLLSEQNEMGGFRSTQDTVLGLQALSEYAALVYTAPRTDITLTVTSNTGDTHTFPISTDKLLLLQSHLFPHDTTSLQLSATGLGLAIVKVAWQYNVLVEPKKQTAKSISVTVNTEKVNDDLFRITGCFKSDDTNLGMTILSMEKQTEMSLANIEELEAMTGVRKVEDKDNHIYLYFDEPTREPQCGSMNMQRDSPIMNLQKASLKATVYYQPEIEEEISYTIAEASSQIDICTICESNACPLHCPQAVDCNTCGNNCPKRCDTSGGSTTWRMDGMLLSIGICLLFSLIMAL